MRTIRALYSAPCLISGLCKQPPLEVEKTGRRRTTLRRLPLLKMFKLSPGSHLFCAQKHTRQVAHF